MIRAIVSDGNEPILLCGHCHTVFSKRGVYRRPFSISDDKAFGAGVADTKSGLITNTFILAAFQKLSSHPNHLVALFTGDEEIGSPASKDVIIAKAKNTTLAFNSKPARSNGNIITGRKVGIFCNYEIVGVAAHSGGFLNRELSAIEDIERMVQALHAPKNLATVLQSIWDWSMVANRSIPLKQILVAVSIFATKILLIVKTFWSKCD